VRLFVYCDEQVGDDCDDERHPEDGERWVPEHMPQQEDNHADVNGVADEAVKPTDDQFLGGSVGAGVPRPRTVKAQARQSIMAEPRAQSGNASQRKEPKEHSIGSVAISQAGKATNSRPGTSSMKRVVLRAVMVDLGFLIFD
jgi:hypothetical protein